MITIEVQGRRLRGQPLEHDFPDYRRLLHDIPWDGGAYRVTVDVAALRTALAPGPPSYGSLTASRTTSLYSASTATATSRSSPTLWTPRRRSTSA